jgi:hypothetical protein
MAEKHLLSHQFPGQNPLAGRLAETGIRFDRSGENVAFHENAEGAHRGLMNSPRHRDNILSPEFNAVGVGVVRRDGLLWVTQDFVRRLEFFTVEQAEGMIAREFERLRRQSGQPPLTLSSVESLRRLACRMAEQNRLDTRSALEMVGSGHAVAFTASTPSQLPDNARRMAQQPGFSRYSLGACFAESEKYPSGAYWVVMVFQ